MRHPAFLSYSRKDTDFTIRLHRELETYRIPRRVDCTIPLVGRRLYPIYLDQYESAASADLGAQIKDSLEQSSALVVICTPAGAGSQWVNEEIRYFRSLGRGNRIFCVLAEGEPSAAFPPALLEVSAAGATPGFAATQPAAADFRHPELPGKARQARLREEKLRLIAGLIGAQPEDLRRRDREQTLRRRTLVATLVLVATLLSLSAVLWQRARYQESLRTARIQDYFDKGQRHLLAGDPLKALPYLGAAYEEDPKNRDLRFLLARAMAPLDARKWVIPPGPSKIVAAEFSPDGRWLLTAYRDGTLFLRNAVTGKVERTFERSTDELESLAFAPDSRTLATVSGNTVRLWDTATGRIHATLSGHTLDVKMVDFSPDGKLIVTASTDNTARLWDAASGRLVWLLRGHSASVVWARFSPDGRKVLTVGKDRTARVWDTATGRTLLRLEPERAVSRGRFSPDGKRIMLVGNRFTNGMEFVSLYAADGRTLATWKKGKVVEADFAPDGQELRIISSGEGGRSIKVWALPGEELLYTLTGHTELVTVFQFSKDLGHLITAGFDPAPRVWNLSTGDLEAMFNISPRKDPLGRAVGFADFAPGSSRLLLVTGDGEISVWDSGFEHRSLEGHEPGLFYVSYSPDGAYLFSASQKTLRIWRSSGEPITKIEPPGGIIRVIPSPTGRRILTAAPDTNAHIWSVPEGHLLATLKGHIQEISAADFSADGRTIVTAGSDGRTNLWDTETGHRIGAIPPYPARLLSAQLSPDGKTILLTALDGSATVWDTASARRICTLVAPSGMLDRVPARFSTDGKTIVTGGTQPKIWKTRCVAVAQLPQHFNGEVGQFSPDSSRFVTYGIGDPIRIWRTADGTLSSTLQQRTIPLSTVQFSPDGAWILIAGSLWNAATGRFVFSPGRSAEIANGAFSRLGDEVALASTVGTLEILNLRLESRSSGQIIRRIQTLTPWRIKNGTIR